jgi:hypothetical protein
VVGAFRKIVEGFKTADLWGLPTWKKELVALAAFTVFFIVGVESNFYWGMISGIGRRRPRFCRVPAADSSGCPVEASLAPF